MIDTPVVGPPRIRIHRDARRCPWPQTAYVCLKDIGIDPHGGEIRDRIQLHVRLHVRIGQRVAFHNVSGDGRIHHRVVLGLAARFHCGNLLLRHAVLPQPFFCGGEHPLALLASHAVHILRKGLIIFLCQQQLLLAAYQVRAIDAEQLLPLAYILVVRIRPHILDPSRKACLHISQLLLVDVHVARCVQRLAHVLHLCYGGLHADLLQPLRRELNRRKRRLAGLHGGRILPHLCCAHASLRRLRSSCNHGTLFGSGGAALPPPRQHVTQSNRKSTTHHHQHYKCNLIPTRLHGFTSVFSVPA